jgi:hypothetical protein
MIGRLGPARRKEFGLASNDELFDPVTNAQAALKVLRGSGWSAWTTNSKVKQSDLREGWKNLRNSSGGAMPAAPAPPELPSAGGSARPAPAPSGMNGGRGSRASAAPFTGSTGSNTPSVASKPSAPVSPVAMSPELRDDTPFRSFGGGSSTVALAASNTTQTQYVFVGGSKNEGITPREIQRLMLNA